MGRGWLGRRVQYNHLFNCGVCWLVVKEWCLFSSDFLLRGYGKGQSTQDFLVGQSPSGYNELNRQKCRRTHPAQVWLPYFLWLQIKIHNQVSAHYALVLKGALEWYHTQISLEIHRTQTVLQTHLTTFFHFDAWSTGLLGRRHECILLRK